MLSSVDRFGGNLALGRDRVFLRLKLLCARKTTPLDKPRCPFHELGRLPSGRAGRDVGVLGMGF